MDTNSVSSMLQMGEEAITVVKGLSPELLTILACIVIGYGLRMIPCIGNKWIPPILIFLAGPIIYIKSSFPDWDAFFDMQWPIVKQAILGMIFGLAAWTAHKGFLRNSKLEKWLFGEDTAKELPANSHL